jgi:predicted nuclease with TOPRIM domain
MQYWNSRLKSTSIFGLCYLLLAAQTGFAGVSRPIQDRYRREYENKAMFLKIPLYSERQYVFISGSTIRPELAVGAPRLKVGDQVRILTLDFGGDEIKFKLSAITAATQLELIYKFDAPLEDEFPNSAVFDKALSSSFTEGLKYTDIEDAKRTFVEDEFERIVREIANTTGTSRDAVLKNIAPRLPAYRDAQKDIDNLKSRTEEMSARIAQLQTDNRKLETELKSQQAETARLKTANSGLQQKLDNTAAELARLGTQSQGYQKDLAEMQRSLNQRVDANRELSSQIADLGQGLRKLQKENETLTGQNAQLKSGLDSLKSQNSKLSGELEEEQGTNRKLRDTIQALTSKEDSLARQYLQLKNVKENLENVALSFTNLNSRVAEEKSEGGIRSGRINLLLRNIPVGTLDYRFPEHISPNDESAAEARFSTESVDYVKVTPEERHILRSLGDRLKLQVKLASVSDGMLVSPETPDEAQDVGERASASWRWKLTNRGTEDGRIVLTARLINRNADAIQVLQEEHLIQSSSMVRQFRTYLQPIPMAVGAILGFVLFGIAGIFRRSRTHDRRGGHPASPGTESTPYVGQKQL